MSLHDSYVRLLSRLGKQEQTALRASQRDWLKARRRCASSMDPVACLSDVYAKRQTVLRGQGQALRMRAAVPPAVSAGSGAVRCVLPTGERIATTLLDCRERSGVRLQTTKVVRSEPKPLLLSRPSLGEEVRKHVSGHSAGRPAPVVCADLHLLDGWHASIIDAYVAGAVGL